MPRSTWFATLLFPFFLVGGAASFLEGSLITGMALGCVASAISGAVVYVHIYRLKKSYQRLTEAAQLFALEALKEPFDFGTPRKALETAKMLLKRHQALRQDFHSLAAVIDGLEDGVWLTDEAGNVVRCNDTLLKMVSWNKEWAPQRPIMVFRRAELQAAVTEACEAGKTSQLDLMFENSHLAVFVAPLGHGLPGSMAVFKDVTPLRNLEKIRKDFIANVSHELGTPITAIRGYAETLLHGALSDPTHAHNMVEIIHRQAQRMSSLVNDLLELSRIESGAVATQNVPLQVAALVKRATDAVSPKAREKGIVLSTEVSSSFWVQGDERGLEQVLLNLLDNAIKYTPQEGRVNVEAHFEEGRCRILVSDTGIGIETRHLTRVFERFYRVDSGRSRDAGGTGLGLAIVKHWMTAMKGDVQVASEPGRGSTFSVYLPSFSYLDENLR